MTTPETKTTVVLASGGLDSTVAIAMELYQQRSVAALTINYGQRHTAELLAVQSIIDYYQRDGQPITHTVIDVSNLGPLLKSALTDPSKAIPEGHYAEPSMAATIVPNRNMILLAIASGYAASIGSDRVTIGCHGGDHYIYPDCREGFIEAADLCVDRATEGQVAIHAPLLSDTKTAVVRTGVRLGVPLHLTWSCYQTPTVRWRHCGVCGTCNERKEAFKLAGVPDPTTYME
jgi:7-cyano-7-deazaguanine synthase